MVMKFCSPIFSPSTPLLGGVTQAQSFWPGHADIICGFRRMTRPRAPVPSQPRGWTKASAGAVRSIVF
jgi:hypothetical protein